ncbi:hypothetical protein [Nocardioides jensenii]|uniref:hypothetical protein n=1 Tax=Nocardioides jensenii TaxID=1843 RepID=UPI00082BA11A|nr:hypothetical protein [Nocardioides jensenii]
MTHPTRGLPTVLNLAVLLVSGVMVGWGLATVLSSEQVSASAADVGLRLAALGFVVGVAALTAWSRIADPRSGLTVWHAAATLLAGGALGVLLCGLALEVDHSGWVALVLLAAAALVWFLASVSGRKHRAKANRERDLITSGTHTMAVVVDRGYAAIGERNMVNTFVWFEFTDTAGTTHRVRKRLLIREGDPIENGQETQLWYDASAPDDVDRMVIQLHREHRPF